MAQVTLLSSKLMTALKASTLALVCFSALMPAQAVTFYKSIGEFGEVKFTQLPPVDADEVVEIDVRSDGRIFEKGSLSNRPTQASATKPTSIRQSTSTKAPNVKAPTALEAAGVRERRCLSLRSNLSNLNTGKPLYRPDGDGGRHVLTAQEIEAEKQKTETLLSRYCSEAMG